MKEQDIQKAISDYLEYNGFLVIKINNVGIFNQGTGSYIPPRQKGVSDLIACKNGIFYAFEVKNEKGKLTDHQKVFLERVKSVGGVAEVVRSVDDVIKLLK